MGSVSPSSALWSLVNLDVAQNEFIGLQSFYLGIGFEVSEQVQNNLDGFCWPSSLGYSPLLSLSSSTGGTGVSFVRNTSLVFEDLVQVFLGSDQVHSLEDTGSVVGILEVGSDIVTLGLNG